MIKTYLVPITDELIKAMEKDEAPSFLHCATCLDGLTNGEVIQKMFPNARCNTDDWKNLVWFGITEHNSVLINKAWWNGKWGK